MPLHGPQEAQLTQDRQHCFLQHQLLSPLASVAHNNLDIIRGLTTTFHTVTTTLWETVSKKAMSRTSSLPSHGTVKVVSHPRTKQEVTGLQCSYPHCPESDLTRLTCRKSPSPTALTEMHIPLPSTLGLISASATTMSRLFPGITKSNHSAIFPACRHTHYLLETKPFYIPILLPLPCKCWDYWHVTSHSVCRLSLTYPESLCLCSSPLCPPPHALPPP